MKNTIYSAKGILLALRVFVLLIFVHMGQAFETVSAQDQLCIDIGSSAGSSQGHSMVLTADSGYAIAGHTSAFGAGGDDVYIVKLSKKGTLEWTRTVGGSSNDYGRSIVQTSDGGYAVAGWTNSFGAGGSDYYIIKLDAAGAVQWTRTVGGTGTDLGWEIVQTTDGGYAIAGQTASFGASPNDMYLVKLDAGGTLQWDRRIGQTSTADLAYSLVQTPDGGYALCGTTYTWTGSAGTSNNDFYIVKVTAAGALAWTQKISNPDPSINGNDYARSIINTADGGLMVVGDAEMAHSSGGKDWHYYAVKLSSAGALEWTRLTGGRKINGYEIDNSDYPESVIQTADGGYVIGGWSFSFNYDYSTGKQVGLELLIMKLDGTGNYVWSKVIGTEPYINDIGKSIVQTPDGGFAMAGYKEPSPAATNYVYFMKTDANVEACCTRSLAGDRGTGGTASATGTISTTAGISGTGGTYSSGGTIITVAACGSVIPPPTALFQSSDTTICSSDCINFTNLGANATSWLWSFPGGTPSSSAQENPFVCYQTPGTYDVSLWAYNSSGSDSAKVSGFIQVIASPPTPTITQSYDTLFCSFDPTYTSYQWYDGNAAISGATGSYHIIDTSGNYNVQVSNENGCKVAVGINVILSASSYKSTGNISVYPNPASSELVIESSRIATGSVVSVSIINMLGQVMQTDKVTWSSRPVINIESLSAGIYTIRIEQPGKAWYGKFVRE